MEGVNWKSCHLGNEIVLLGKGKQGEKYGKENEVMLTIFVHLYLF